MDLHAPPVVPAPVPGDTGGLERLVGERTVPDLWHENYWFRRHEAAYVSLAARVADATGPSCGIAVEAGAGEGYGVPLLRRAGASRIAALDYDAAAVRHGRARYPQAAWARTNLARLPLADRSVAAVTSFQVIEHLWTPWEFLAECARVLRPGGLLVLTTPNRPVFSPGLGRHERPPNPYHVREYDAAELCDTVAAHLTVEAVLGVVHGPRLRAWEARHGGLMAPQVGGPPTRWPAELAELVRSVTAADFDVLPVDPDAEPGLHDPRGLLDRDQVDDHPDTRARDPHLTPGGDQVTPGDQVIPVDQAIPVDQVIPVHDLVVLARAAAA